MERDEAGRTQSVPVDALRAFIEYADGLRAGVDSEYNTGPVDDAISQGEFDGHLAALGWADDASEASRG